MAYGAEIINNAGVSMFLDDLATSLVVKKGQTASDCYFVAGDIFGLGYQGYWYINFPVAGAPTAFYTAFNIGDYFGGTGLQIGDRAAIVNGENRVIVGYRDGSGVDHKISKAYLMTVPANYAASVLTGTQGMQLFNAAGAVIFDSRAPCLVINNVLVATYAWNNAGAPYAAGAYLTSAANVSISVTAGRQLYVMDGVSLWVASKIRDNSPKGDRRDDQYIQIQRTSATNIAVTMQTYQTSSSTALNWMPTSKTPITFVEL